MILQDTLRYLNLQPQYTQAEQRALTTNQVTVPNLKGQGFEQAIGILGGLGLSYQISGGNNHSNFVITDQSPEPGAKIGGGGTVTLYWK